MRKSTLAPTSEPAPSTATVTGGLAGLDSSIAHTHAMLSALTLSMVAANAGLPLISASTWEYVVAPDLSTASLMTFSSGTSALTLAALMAIVRTCARALRRTVWVSMALHFSSPQDVPDTTSRRVCSSKS